MLTNPVYIQIDASQFPLSNKKRTRSLSPSAFELFKKWPPALFFEMDISGRTRVIKVELSYVHCTNNIIRSDSEEVDVNVAHTRRNHPTLRSHTRPKLGSLLLFFQISCDIISDLSNLPIFAFLMTMVIRLSCTNRIQYYHALDALFRTLFLKSTKYYAHYYYRKSFGLKQDMQNIHPMTYSFYHTIN